MMNSIPKSTEPQSNEQDILKQALRKASDSIKDLIAENEALKNKSAIAIVGMACRFPGGGSSPDAFWELLNSGVDAIIEAPESRWPTNAFLSEDPKAPGKMYTAQGGFLREPIDQFDANFFGITPNEAKAMDPQHRLLLEVAWEAFENAFQTPEKLKFSKTGVYIGISGDDYALNHRHSHNPASIDAYSITGSTFSTAAGRISYTFGLQGPCMALDTACSSSLVAIHQAIKSLQSKESDMALAGGVNLILHPEMHIGFSKLQAISPDGRCKTFDASANGYVRGEGCGMVVLKRLEDAKKDGDQILGVIKGSAINQDGKTNGLAAPNGNAQQAVIQDALKNANLNPKDVDYIEAHGTGTVLGDPIEVEALGAMYGRDRKTPLLLGSVKTNIGHLEPVAGMAGIAKILLSLEHQRIPKNLHFHQANPHISWESLPLKVIDESTPWPKSDRARIAGLSSFGFSGTNAHLIISEYQQESSDLTNTQNDWHLLNLSAQDENGLKELAKNYLHLLQSRTLNVQDLCFSASLGRHHWTTRLSIVGKDQAELMHGLNSYLNAIESPNVVAGEVLTSQPKIAFLFTGQGSQYWSMGSQLYESEPVFKEAFDQCDAILKEISQVSIKEILFTSPSEQIRETAITQPALFSLAYALCQLWASWGIKPNFVMGHSVGEYAAACVAQVFTLQDGLKLISHRGRLMQSLPSGGGMAAILSTQKVLEPFLKEFKDQIEIAAFNSPSQILVSGDAKAIEVLCEKLSSQQIRSHVLTVSHAFHSYLMDDISQEFQAITNTIKYSNPSITIIPNLYGKEMDGSCTTSEYWTKHIRQPVRFSEGILALEAKGVDAYLEIGPDPILLGIGKQSTSKPAQWLASLKKSVPEQEQLYRSLARLYTLGANIHWAGVFKYKNSRWVSIPNYPFQRKSYWSTPAQLPSSANSGQGIQNPFGISCIQSPLLGSDVITADLSVKSLPLLQEHQVLGRNVFAAASYISLLIESAFALQENASGSPHLKIENILFQKPLVLPEQGIQEIQVGIDKGDTSPKKLSFISIPAPQSADYLTHLTGFIDFHPQCTTQTPRLAIDQFNESWASLPTFTAADEIYSQLSDSGIQLGRPHQWLVELKTDGSTALAKLATPCDTQDATISTGEFALHPGLLDSCFCFFASLIKVEKNKTFLPFSLRSFTIFKRAQGDTFYARIKLSQSETATKKYIGDIELFNSNGELIAECLGLEGREASAVDIEKSFPANINSLLYEIDWLSKDSLDEAADTKPLNYLFLNNNNPLDLSLIHALKKAGNTVTTVSKGNNFRAVGDEVLEMNPHSKDDFAKLAAALKKVTKSFDGMIYSWGMNVDGSKPKDLYQGCKPLIYLLQEINHLQTLSPQASLSILTSRAQNSSLFNTEAIVDQLPLWGLGKTISVEYPHLHTRLIDLDPSASDKENCQFVINHLTLPSSTSYRLAIPASGSLADLSWQSCERKAPVANEVEIEVHTTGLNFKDILLALHRVNAVGDGLGVECAGTIARVGPGVTQFAVGDRVLAMVPGSLSRFVCAPVATTAALPPDLEDGAAATIPITFLTAAYALESLAKIGSGDRVLIHAGTGGVGQAAIQIAQRAGAQVFATASQGKWQILKDLGVKHIFDSRTTGFESAINQLTDGKGVDIVLNSLAGEFTDASLRLLKPGGRFLEIGITDLRTPAQVEQISPGIKYFPIDLMDLYRDERALLQTLLQGLLERFAKGELKPLSYQLYPASTVETAFRTMQQAKHTGKVVIDLQQNPVKIEGEAELVFRSGKSWSPRLKPLQRPASEAYKIHADGNYVIIGGLGGLGLLMAKNLIERGAQHLALCGRSLPDAKTLTAIDELRKSGATIEIAQLDSLDFNAAQNWITSINSANPIKGILYLAGQIQDGMIANQTWGQFQKALPAKTIGLENIDQISRQLDLEFFIAFSSLTSITGSPGQANYVAANTFVDGLMKLRRTIGLPGNSINWGPWEEAGMAQRLNQSQMTRLHDMGILPLDSKAALESFNTIGPKDPAQIGIMAMNWQHFIKQFPNANSNPFYENIRGNQKANLIETASGKNHAKAKISGWRDALLSSPYPQRSKLLIKLLESGINLVIGANENESIGLRKPLFDLGLDSLTAVELKNRIEANLGCALSPTLLFDYPTLEALSEHLKSLIPELFETTPIDSTPIKLEESESAGEDFDEMSQDELERLLASKIKH